MSVQYIKKQSRRQEKYRTHAQRNTRSQQLLLFQLHNHQLYLSLLLSLYQEEKDIKQLSYTEAQRDLGVYSQKCKFSSQDQPTLGESYQLTFSRSLILRCLYERHQAYISLVQCAKKPISPRTTTSNLSSPRGRYYCTSRALEKPPHRNKHFNCFLFFSSSLLFRDWQNTFSY